MVPISFPKPAVALSFLGEQIRFRSRNLPVDSGPGPEQNVHSVVVSQCGTEKAGFDGAVKHVTRLEAHLAVGVQVSEGTLRVVLVSNLLRSGVQADWTIPTAK